MGNTCVHQRQLGLKAAIVNLTFQSINGGWRKINFLIIFQDFKNFPKNEFPPEQTFWASVKILRFFLTLTSPSKMRRYSGKPSTQMLENTEGKDKKSSRVSSHGGEN